MINFKEVEIKDKKWIETLLTTADLRASHQNFGNIFAWKEVFNYQVAQVNDYFVLKGLIEEGPYYFFPAGEGEVLPVLEKLREDAEKNNHDFVMLGLSPENVETLKELYPEKFEFKEMRDSFDYVYLIEKMANLRGRKMQAKRNHINRFVANNEWAFELINPDNLAECWEMNLEWCSRNDCNDDPNLAAEACAVLRNFEYFKELELEGGLIRVDGKVIAFTMGERLNSDTYIIHVEKAFGEIQGAYQIINREFIRWVNETYPELVYVNREEDMGYEGLRKAKLSYRPDMMIEKYSARYFG
ncbi:MAG: DUF2156 domain-containing protein [Desulfitobacterium sp.]|nr:DUF2156 domain-containing protein [Desulfitobacterium sp.]